MVTVIRIPLRGIRMRTLRARIPLNSPLRTKFYCRVIGLLKTYNQLYIDTRNTLRAHGVESPNLEARLLVARAAGKTQDELVRDFTLYTGEGIIAEAEAMIARRLAGEPLAYILGTWEFYGLDLNVTPDVLIPRVDTEVLVDQAIGTFLGRMNNPRVLDLCCGSGCIGCAIGTQLPKSRIVMVDLSDKALRVARSNVMKCMLGARVSCVKADAFQDPPAHIGTFDLIVSNPPYIRTMDILTLDTSVRDYEPLEALDGGQDGFDFYEAILKHWKSCLRPGGYLMFEVGEEQSGRVIDLMRLAGFHHVKTTLDTGCTERVVSGQLE